MWVNEVQYSRRELSRFNNRIIKRTAGARHTYRPGSASLGGRETMNDYSIPENDSAKNTNFGDRVDLVLRIPGSDKHFVSLNVLFTHLKLATQDVTLPAGYYDIVVDHDGRVYVDEKLIFTPKALEVKEGAA